MNHMVYVIDDDDSVRHAMVRLLQSAGYSVAEFASAEAFLTQSLSPLSGCLVLDMNLPHADGFYVLDALEKKGQELPIIFITGFGTIPMSVRAMKAGAHEFLTKPVAPEDLLNAVDEGLIKAEKNQLFSSEQSDLTLRHQSLTPREREVLGLAIGGLLIKQIATALGVSEITAKVHKRRVMEKMRTRSLADLVRAAERLHIVKSQSR